MSVTALFDKSFLQSLSENESVWFDHFFLAVVSPVFFIETLADLAKQNLSQGRSPEAEVSILAAKTPSRQGSPCVQHQTLALNSLFGAPVPMNGQVPVPGARVVNTEHGVGAYYGQSDESRAFLRWQEEKFAEVERAFASQWRKQLSELDLSRLAAPFEKLGVTPQSVKTLDDAKQIADSLVDNPGDPRLFMRLVFDFFGFPSSAWEEVMSRWQIYKFRPLKHHAPYLAHVLTVEIFFRIAIASKLIAGERKSNRTDIAYLYYLPFCHVMVSTDKLHRRCAPLFLRTDQEFVWGADLKNELHRIHQHFSDLPEARRRLGLFAIAPSPVGHDGDLLIQLYDRHAPLWRSSASSAIKTLQETDLGRKLHEQVEAMKTVPVLEPSEVPAHPDNLQSISISRSLRAKRGDWWIIPAEVAEKQWAKQTGND